VNFAGSEPNARMYGYVGRFEVTQQEQRAYVLFSEMRKVSDARKQLKRIFHPFLARLA